MKNTEEYNRQQKTKTFPIHFKINGKTVTDKRAIANTFNNYVVNIGPTLANDIPQSPTEPTSFIKQRTIHTLFLKPVIKEKVAMLVKSIKSSSPGWDYISPYIVKSTLSTFIGPLTHVLNLSITKGVFPNELKIAKVLPFFKSSDNMLITNYRPISVLPIFSKILEKLMYTRLLEFINKHKILYDYQFGFRKLHSTTMALMILVDKITTALDEGNSAIGIFLDFRKAFDTVDHNILFKKLECYGVRGLSLSWFKSYLTNRKQFVNYDVSNPMQST